MGFFQGIVKSKFDIDTLLERLTDFSYKDDGIEDYETIIYFSRHNPLHIFCEGFKWDN